MSNKIPLCVQLSLIAVLTFPSNTSASNFTSNGVNTESCEELQAPPGSPLLINYELITIKGTAGRRAIFTCKPGYYLEGQAIIDCIHDQWEHQILPQCLRYCPQPPYIKNGGLEIAGWAFDDQGYPNGTVAHYTCGSEYRLEPTHAQQRICLNGVWSGSSAFCVAQGCQLADAGIPDGFYIQDTVAPGLLRLRYGCHSGYTLLGSAERECGEEGSWTPLQPPSCIKLDNNGEVPNSEDEQGCPPPPAAPGTVVSRLRGLITANHAAPNSEVVLRCAEGKRDAEGPCEPAHLRCSGGAWHGRAPVCVEFDGCVALPGIPRGSLLGLSDDGRYSVGSRVVFTCQPGYRLHGQPIFSCESSGCWSPTMLPECLPEFYLPSGWEEYALSPGAALLASLGTALAVMALLLAVCLAVVCRRRRRSPRHTSSSSSHASRRLRWPADEGAEAPIQTAPPAALIPPDPDRVALIAFADGLQVGQSVLPSYEEATRGGSGGGAGTGVLYGALHRGRGPHWTALGSGGGGGRRGRRERHAAPPLQDGDTLSHHSLHGCTRQSSSTSHSASLRSCAAMGGSTDTVAAGSDGSTAVTLDTVSSHSRDASSLASCSGGAGSSGCSSQTASCRAICGSLASFDTSSVLNTEGVPLLEESELEGAAEARADEEETTPPSTTCTSSGPSGEVKIRGGSPDALN